MYTSACVYVEQHVTFLTLQDEMVETEECFANPMAFLAQAQFSGSSCSLVLYSVTLFSDFKPKIF